MSALKSLARNWLPPVVASMLRKSRGVDICFEGKFATWEAAAAHCTGYEADQILTKVLEATLKVKRGEAAFERDSVLFDQIEYSWPVTAGLLWSAARSDGRLDVLDFGGALGSSYFQNRKFLQPLKEVRWNVVEQEHYVSAGKKHVQDKTLRFYSTVDSCLRDNMPNVILLSSVLQYLPDPDSVLDKLIRIGASSIILDRMPYLNSAKGTLIKIQKIPSSIYPASYPCRFFVEEIIVKKMAVHKYELLESFNSLDELDNSATWKGHVFYKASIND